MKKYLCILALLILSCSDEGVSFYEGNYDIILLVGQSNTHSGAGLDIDIDTPHELIKQLGRFKENNLNIIAAIEPLDNYTKQNNQIGFALTFAKKYANEILEKDREILIIPCGYAGTGFIDNRWNKGNDLYEDAVQRTKTILKTKSNCRLVAVLWHQGEEDIFNRKYKIELDRFIINLRKDLGNSSTPFILGGMVPYWVNQLPERIQIQEIIENTPNRLNNTKYVNPTIPFTISKNDNDFNSAHYDAKGMRELGNRYFIEFKLIIEN